MKIFFTSVQIGKWVCVLVMLLLALPNLQAQCPGTITISSTDVVNATCPSNGEISVNAGSLPATATYQITAGPASGGYQTTAQSTNHFTSLPPGNYTIQVVCGTTTAQTTVTVPNRYTLLDMTLSVANACGPTPTIMATGTGGKNLGTGQLRYALIKSTNAAADDALFTYGGPVSSGVQQTLPLPSPGGFGQYQVRVKDECNNFTTRSIEVVASYPVGQTALEYGEHHCDSGENRYYFGLFLQRADGTGTAIDATNSGYTIRLYYNVGCSDPLPATPDVERVINSDANLDFDVSETSVTSIRVRIISPCGEVHDDCYTVPATSGIGLYGSFYLNCSPSGGVGTVGFRIGGATPMSTSYEVTGTGATGWTGTQTFTSSQFTVPFSESYLITAKDGCGNTGKITFDMPDPGSASASVEVGLQCTSSTGTYFVKVNIWGYVPGIADPGTTGVLIDEAGNVIANPTANLNDNATWYFYNIPPGNYKIRIQTQAPCASTYDLPISVPDNNQAPLIFSLDGSATQFCGGTGSITGSLNYNGGAPYSFQLLDADGTVSATSTAGTFTGLAAGTYTIKAIVDLTTNCVAGLTLSATKQLTIQPAGAAPVVLKKLGIICENSDGTQTTTGKAIFAFSGYGPFIVQMKKTAEPESAFVLKGNAIPNNYTFDGLEANTDYDVRIIDQCGTATSTQVSTKSLVAVNLEGAPVQPCVGQPYILSVEDVVDATYEWSKNGIVVGISRQLSFGNYSAASNGDYICKVILAGGCATRYVYVTLNSASCGNPIGCQISVVVQSGACASATNTYSSTAVVTLLNSTAGVLTVTDGTHSLTFTTTAAGSATFTASFTALTSDGLIHTVTASLPDCSTATTTYTAPVSCSVASCGLAMTVTPGLCLSATNSYVLSGSITATNVPTSGTLTISSGAFTTRTLSLPTGNASGTFSYSGLVSNGQTYTVTASYSNAACSPVSQVYTAPASCSVAPVCSLSATATAGLCATATNAYSATVVVNLTNANAGTLTVSIPGSTPINQTIAANTSSFTAVFAGLTSDGAGHTATISLPGCGTTTATYTAPASCSIAPVCSVSAVATVGLCQTATNTYSSTVVVTVRNPSAGTLSVSDGSQTLTFSTTANAQNTFTVTFNGLSSDGTTHTVTASLPGCSTATTTYTAPASCSIAPVCSISAVATAGLCASATNTYSSTVVVTVKNPSTGTITIADGSQTQTFSTTASSQNTFTVIFSGLLSNGASHSVSASLPGCSTAITTYTAPASCSVTPSCNLSLTASGTNCNPTTNLYVLSGAITVTNSPSSQTLTLTDGSYVRSLTVASGTTTINYSYTTLQSDGALHTVTLTSSASACGTASTTYTAPASCSTAPVCSVSAVATAGICATATNTYSNTVLVTLTNPTAGTLTVSNGVNSVTFVIPASVGTLTTSAIFNGLVSDGASHLVTVSLPGCSTTTASYTAPANCSTAPVCSVSAVATAGLCASATSTYSAIAVVTVKNASAGVLTVTNGAQSLTFATTAVSSATFTATFNGLTADGSSHTVTASLPGCSTTTTTYTAPGSCTQPAGTQLALDKLVNKSRAIIGEVLTYTLVLTNTGTTTATNVVVRDSMTTGLHYVANSATAPAGTTFTQGTPISNWKVASISAGQSLSLTFQALADSSGILYNVATIPGDTATVCTSIPVKMCVGDSYTFRLAVAPGRSSYKWFRDGVEIAGQTTNVLDVTGPGAYSLAVDNVSGRCPDFSCCPFIVEEDSLPTFRAVAVPVTCVGSVAQSNGQLVLSNFKAGNSYQYSLGSTFNEAAPASGAIKVIPSNGVLVSNLVNPATAQSYTIRVYNASGCYMDMTLLLLPTVCACPEAVCVPLVIKQTKSAKWTIR